MLKKTPDPPEDRIREAFKNTISGTYLTNCVKNGTMDKEFLENQFSEFKAGFKSRDEEVERLEEEIKLNANALDWSYKERMNYKRKIDIMEAELEEMK